MSIDPLLHRTFDGITLSRQLGSGAMGTVYRGHDAARDRDVAVKLLPRNDSDQRSAHQARRLLREAQALMSVEHPHVVKVHGTGSTDDYHFLIMDFIDGADLGQVVKKNGPLTDEALLATARALASGLAALHAAGVVHRDLEAVELPSVTRWSGEDLRPWSSQPGWHRCRRDAAHRHWHSFGHAALHGTGNDSLGHGCRASQ